MTKRSRQELENKFRSGTIPKETDFFELFESIINFEDDGIDIEAGNKVILSGSLQVGNTANVHELQVLENASITKNIIVTGSGVFNSDVNIDGDVILGSDVSDKVKIAGVLESTDNANPLTINARVNCQEDVTFAKNIQLNGEITSALQVGGAATFNSDLSINGNLQVKGNVIARDEEHIKGDIQLGDNDEDKITIQGIVCSTHSSGNLHINSPIKLKDGAVIERFSSETGLSDSTSSVASEQVVKSYVDTNFESLATMLNTVETSIANTNNVLSDTNNALSLHSSVITDHDYKITDLESTVTDQLLHHSVPTGAIIMWSGSIDTTPDGWSLCDGNNGTPNLSGRFILAYDAANNSRNVGDTGGEESHLLNLGEMPKHNHNVSIEQMGNHTHAITAAGSHTHTINSAGQHSHSIHGTDHQNTPAHVDTTSYEYGVYRENYTSTSVSGEHSHNESPSGHHSHVMNSTGLHQHNVNEASVGNNEAHNNMPPYYVLAYLIKTV